MYFESIDDISRIASQCGTAIFVVPDDIKIILKNALTLKPEEKSVITIEQVRDLQQRLGVKQYTDQFVIIRPADKMNPEAANALLKSLEEPGDRTHFVLITERPSQLLPTILSRASLYFLRQKNDLKVIKANDKIKNLAKRLLVAKGEELVTVAEEITRKPDGVRAFAMEVLGTAIEMLTKSYLLTGKDAFLKKLPRFLRAYEGISRNGHVKLQIVANLC